MNRRVTKSIKTMYGAFHGLEWIDRMAMTSAKRKTSVPTGAARARNLHRLWKPLLILSVLAPFVVLLYSWSQAGFIVPMSSSVFDQVTSNVAALAALIGLVALSFTVQYHYGSPKTRRTDVRSKTPLIILLGLGVGLVSLALRWWVDPSSTRSVVSDVFGKPFVAGSTAGLIASGLVLAFVLSSREEQRRVLRAASFFLAAFLTFGGPTYLIYGLQNVGLPYPLLILGGLVAFVVGVVLLVRLIGKQTKLGVF